MLRWFTTPPVVFQHEVVQHDARSDHLPGASQLERKPMAQARELFFQPAERVFDTKTCAGVKVVVKPLLSSGGIIIRGSRARIYLRESRVAKDYFPLPQEKPF